MTVDLTSNEALKTSEIEGEFLNRDSILSSIRRNFGLETDDRKISPVNRERLARMAQRFSFFGIIVIGGFFAIVELPCTGGPNLAITAILAKSLDQQAFIYLCVYDFIFNLQAV